MKNAFLFLASFLFFQFSFAQKKPLDHSVYDGWQQVSERLISNDGKWVVYTIVPQEGDNELVIQSADAAYRKSVARGYSAIITEDNRYVIFKIKPLYKDIRAARIRKKKADDMPKDSLGIVELGKEGVWKRSGVRNYKTPQRSSGWLAYQLEKPVEQPGNPIPEKKTAPDKDRIADSLQHIIDSLQQVMSVQPKKKKSKEEKDSDGPGENDAADADGDDALAGGDEPAKDLAVRNLFNGEEVYFYKVLEYYFSQTGDRLLVEQDVNPNDSFSVHQVVLYDLRSGECHTLSRGGNEFRNFAMTEDGGHIAYVAEREAKPKDLQKFYRIWHYQTGMDSARLLADRFSVGMKLGMTISEYGALSFSRSGGRLFFGTSPILPPRDTSLVEIDHAKLDIWHYKDDYLQTVQTFPARLKSDLRQNYPAVYQFGSGTIRQLGSPEITQVLLTGEGDGDMFTGISDFGKRIESQWTGYTKKDIYAIDPVTGLRKKVKENLYGTIYPSPGGKYIMWYDRTARHYFAWDGLSVKNITEKIKVPLYDEAYDEPGEPNHYGVMGWGENDEAVYIYDRYDIWKVYPGQQQNPENILAGNSGRKNRDVIRYVSTDPEKRFFKSGDELAVKIFNETTKQSGPGLLILGNPARLSAGAKGDFVYTISRQSKQGSVFIYTKENYNNSPDLYASTRLAAGSETRLSFINPQQKNYIWGSAELVRWKTTDKKDATGILYKPENFDPARKYPVIINFYDKRSDSINYYISPQPSTSRLNIPFFVSRGYLVFTPDVNYTKGHPGKDAVNYIVSGAQWLAKNKWVDAKNIGLQGHSWSGYQVAYLVTATNMFKAAWAGAPVVNMFSGYGGIRWESGMSRQSQYEVGQSRIGATPWEHPELYIENSPLFHLQQVTTPLVIVANDQDGAVPWYQGIEFFTAMRRLGKQIWMLSYNGEQHRLTDRANRKDLQVRQQQYFDWQLKGEKPAKWITEGLPAVKKGKDWGLETVD